MRRTILLIGFLISGTLMIAAQDDVQTPSGGTRPVTPEQIKNRNLERRRQQMARVSNLPRQRSAKKRRRMTKEERRKFEQAIKPRKEDVDRYRKFLKLKNTGIFRMHSNFGCESEKLVKIDGNCAGYVPGTWAYSFRHEEFGNKDIHDIGLVSNIFKSQGLLSQSLLVKLGTLGIEDVGVDTPGLKYLMDFVPSDDRQGAKRQFVEIEEGIESDGFRYASRIPMEPDTTFALRAIGYRMRDEWSSRLWPRNANRITKEEAKFQLLAYDKRIDAVYVFRVIRLEQKGAVTVVWKRLKKSKSPRLVFREDERLEDFGLRRF